MEMETLAASGYAAPSFFWYPLETGLSSTNLTWNPMGRSRLPVMMSDAACFVLNPNVSSGMGNSLLCFTSVPNLARASRSAVASAFPVAVGR